MLYCGDGSLYTGITNNLDERFKKHSTGKGAKYTRGRLPLCIVYTERHATKGAALRREAAIKSLRRDQKRALAQLRDKT